MKKYTKEIIIFAVQLFVFYIFPLFAGPTDAIGMVLLIIISTLWLSALVGSWSDKKIKFLYPVIVSVMFIPSVFMYYNSSALIHSLWYLAVSSIGVALGVAVNIIVGLIMKAKVGGGRNKCGKE